MANCPYSFPARSRSAMVDAMESNGGYYDQRARYPFSWNVKIHRYPSSAKDLAQHNESGEPFNPQWDSAFDQETQSNGFFESIVEDMARDVDDFTMYPGVDQGQFKFTFGGRSGGHMILESAYGIDMCGFDLDELRHMPDARSDWAFAEVKRLYRAVTVMESDFASAKVQSAFAYAVAFRRSQWEEERRDLLAATVAEVSSDQATAKHLLGELRELRAIPTLRPFTASCAVLRRGIRHAIADARAGRRLALALATGESGE